MDPNYLLRLWLKCFCMFCSHLQLSKKFVAMSDKQQWQTTVWNMNHTVPEQRPWWMQRGRSCEQRHQVDKQQCQTWITPSQSRDLDECSGVDLVYDVTRLTARLTVEVVALYEDTVITQTANPHVTLTLQYQLYTLAYVQSTHRHTDRHLQIQADRYTDRQTIYTQTIP